MNWWDYIFTKARIKWHLHNTPDATGDLKYSPHSYKILTKIFPDQEIKNKYKLMNPGDAYKNFWPYLTNYTEKSLEPANAVRTGQYAKLSKGKGQTIPADWANQRAGDPNYVSSQQQQVLDYVSNPKNGWVKQDDGSFKYPATGQIYNPSVASAAAHTPVTTYMHKSPSAWHNPRKRFIMVPSKDTNIYSYMLKQVANDPEVYKHNSSVKYKPNRMMHGKTSSTFAAALPMEPDRINTYYTPLIAEHEVNHAYTAPLLYRGLLIKPVYRDNFSGEFIGSNRYPKLPVELGNAASLFQQQHYRNTGRRIVDKNKFWDDINEAKKNIKDYDPESRRFLQSVDILYNGSLSNSRSADMLMQLQEAMPLITDNKQLPGYNRNYKHNRIG